MVLVGEHLEAQNIQTTDMVGGLERLPRCVGFQLSWRDTVREVSNNLIGPMMTFLGCRLWVVRPELDIRVERNKLHVFLNIGDVYAE